MCMCYVQSVFKDECIAMRVRSKAPFFRLQFWTRALSLWHTLLQTSITYKYPIYPRFVAASLSSCYIYCVNKSHSISCRNVLTCCLTVTDTLIYTINQSSTLYDHLTAIFIPTINGWIYC